LKEKDLAKLEELAHQAATLSGVDLVDVEYGAERGGPVLRLYIDKDGGVTIDDCARVSRAMGDALDTEDPLPFSYRLEVSSPGVDKALKGERDFRRYSGRSAMFVLKRARDGQSAIGGVIIGCEQGAVLVRPKSGEDISIGFDEIARARLDDSPWEMAKMKGKKGHAG
jgi:ribosome maturation factor RimP